MTIEQENAFRLSKRLLPCPNCGTHATLVLHSEKYGGKPVVVCPKNECTIVVGATPQEAVAFWNWEATARKKS